MRHRLADLEATERLGAALAELLEDGDVVALCGEVGAGKTTLVAAVTRALGCAGAASSPTFALVQRYGGGRLIVWHADLYRVERAAELPELGLDEVLGVRGGPEAAVAFVEWADRFPDVLPAAHLRVELAHDGDGRWVEVRGVGDRGQALARAWAHAVAG